MYDTASSIQQGFVFLLLKQQCIADVVTNKTQDIKRKGDVMCDPFSRLLVELGQKMHKVKINSVDPYRGTVAGRSALLTAHVETCQTL